MPEGPNGVDIATLGMRVDATGLPEGVRGLERLDQAGTKAERSLERLETATKSAAQASAERNAVLETEAQRLTRLQRQEESAASAHEAFLRNRKASEERNAAETAARAAETGRQAALAQVDAAERVYQRRVAELKLAQVQGLVSPQEAARAGRDFAIAYNESVRRTLETARQGTFRGAQGQEAFNRIAGSLKNVDQAARRSHLGLGRLNNALVTVSRQAAGADPIVGRLVDTVGTFAIGLGPMTAILAGVTALALGWRHYTEDAREAREETERLTRELLEAARARQQGETGAVEEQLQSAVAARREAEEAFREAQEALQRRRRSGGSESTIEAAAERVREASRSVQEQLDAEAEAVAQLRERQIEVFQQQRDAQAAALMSLIEAGRATSTEVERTRELIRQNEAIIERLAGQGTTEATERRAELIRQNEQLRDALRGEREEVERATTAWDRYEEALRRALERLSDIPTARVRVTLGSQATRERRRREDEAAQLSTLPEGAVDEILADLDAALERLGESADDAGGAFDQTVGKIDVALRSTLALADGLGFLDDSLRGALRGVSDVIGGISAGGGAGALGIVGGAVGFLGAIASLGGNEDRKRLEAERNRLLEQNNERLRAMEEALTGGRSIVDYQGLQRAVDTLAGVDLSDLKGSGVPLRNLQGSVTQAAEDLGIELFDSMGVLIPGALEDLQRAVDLTIQKIEEEIAATENSLQIRQLVAEGRNEEAEALRLQIEFQEEYDEALKLGGPALAAMVEETWAMEAAAREAAEAQREAAEASRLAAVHGDFFQTVLTETAKLMGDDLRLQFLLGQAQIIQVVNSFQELVAAGIITKAELAELGQIMYQGLTKALEEAARAAEEAAEAERLRKQIDMENLRVRLLVARGQDAAAQALREQIEVLQAQAAGADAAYIALLKQVQAAERIARAREEERRAVEETTRAIEGMVRAINAPTGLRLSLLRFRAADPARFAPNAVRVQTGPITLYVQGAAGQPVGDLADAVVSRLQGSWAEVAAVGGDPFAVPGLS